MTRHLSIAVLADVHLGTSDSKAKEVLDYLDSITPDTLVIAGDFIDLDVLHSGKLKREHLAVLRRVLDLANSGSKVYYLTGNHDAQVDKLGALAVDNLFIRRELLLQFDNNKHYFFHGDQLDAAVKYKLEADQVPGVWRKLIGLADRIGVTLKTLTGQQRWSLASEVKTNPAGARAYVEVFERSAIRLAESKGCNHVICAHIHQPKIDIHSEKGKVIHYLNAGDWVDNMTALEYRFGKWKLYKYDSDDYPAVSKRLRTPMQLPSKSAMQWEEELMRRLVKS